MRLTTVPTTDFPLAVLGITAQDVADMQNGYNIEPIDLRRNMILGQPIPQVLQVIYVRDDAEYDARLRRAGLDTGNIKSLPEGEPLA